MSGSTISVGSCGEASVLAVMRKAKSVLGVAQAVGGGFENPPSAPECHAWLWSGLLAGNQAFWFRCLEVVVVTCGCIAVPGKEVCVHVSARCVYVQWLKRSQEPTKIERKQNWKSK